MMQKKAIIRNNIHGGSYRGGHAVYGISRLHNAKDCGLKTTSRTRLYSHAHLWLKNLPRLRPTAEFRFIDNGIKQSIFAEPPSEERSQIRSTTFPDIADAMADQWGALA